MSILLKNLFDIKQKFIKDESGATAIEYGGILALISIMIVSGSNLLGTTIMGKFNSISSALR